MNNKEVLDLINVLTTFKLNKLDDEVANVILNNIAKIVPYSDIFNKVQEQLRKFTLGTITEERLKTFEEERTRLNSLKEKNVFSEDKFVNEYNDVITQQTRFINALNNYLSKEVDIELEKIDYKVFVKNSKNLGLDISYGDLMFLKHMLSNIELPTINITDDEIKSLLN